MNLGQHIGNILRDRDASSLRDLCARRRDNAPPPKTHIVQHIVRDDDEPMRNSHVRQDILSVLAAHPNSSASQVQSHLRGSLQSIQSTLSRLAADGLVLYVGRPALYRLSDPHGPIHTKPRVVRPLGAFEVLDDDPPRKQHGDLPSSIRTVLSGARGMTFAEIYDAVGGPREPAKKALMRLQARREVVSDGAVPRRYRMAR